METGEPVEETTRKLDPDRAFTTQGGETEKPTLSGRNFSQFEAPTRKVAPERQRKNLEGERTRLFRPNAGEDGPVDDDPMADPVAGWLVVVAGPGKGNVRRLGYGSNSLGRTEKCRVRLDFGDDLISRDEHAIVTYDPRGRKFYLQHGGGKNLTYFGDGPVLMPAEIEATQEFTIGRTRLRFIPLCGPEFDWQDDGAE